MYTVSGRTARGTNGEGLAITSVAEHEQAIQFSRIEKFRLKTSFTKFLYLLNLRNLAYEPLRSIRKEEASDVLEAEIKAEQVMEVVTDRRAFELP